ncbi:hypothetical protein [Pelagerythrobacter marinus]|uniref:hypothetical protein n=1 Tax=Pelagerythrobacter marinus TaxID=538382 RepID=UPI0020371B65|nr:hypothetical protein [Pelagerythrobacter marinus]USA38560.1 hypothetical protein NCF86_09485 [Pelagerythrobacter marinus]WPZ07414.1 hypothetical protein T8T98_02560 [Pelagerythrobacter marinus]
MSGSIAPDLSRGIPRVPARAAILLLPFAVVLAGRVFSHGEWAAANPLPYAALFLWLCCEAIGFTLILRAPRCRPGAGFVLTAAALACVIVPLVSAGPVRSALLDVAALRAAMALTVLAFCGWKAALALSAYRAAAGTAAQRLGAAAGAILPPGLLRVVRREAEMLGIALFAWNRAPHCPDNAQGFACHGYAVPVIAALAVLQVLEIAVVHFVVMQLNTLAAWILFALGAWGLLFVVAFLKSLRLRPVLLLGSGVLVRSGFVVEIFVPYEAIARVEGGWTGCKPEGKGVLDLSILSTPNAVLHLARPLARETMFGPPRRVTTIGLRLDEPSPFLAALRARTG